MNNSQDLKNHLNQPNFDHPYHNQLNHNQYHKFELDNVNSYLNDPQQNANYSYQSYSIPDQIPQNLSQQNMLANNYNNGLQTEIQNNEIQIQQLRRQNKQLNEEIAQKSNFTIQQNNINNNNQYIQNNQQQQYVGNNIPYNIVAYNINGNNTGNNVMSSLDQCEIKYCTTDIIQRNRSKYQTTVYNPQLILDYLQAVHSYLNLDYSNIKLIGKANLLKDNFVEKEILNPLLESNFYTAQQDIIASKPVFCCNFLYKKINQYGVSLLLCYSIWMAILITVYAIALPLAKSVSTLALVIYIIQILFMTFEISYLYLAMQHCSIHIFQVLSIVASFGIFFSFVVASASMFTMTVDFELQTGLVCITGFNVLNMFFSLPFLGVLHSLKSFLKKLCAVVKQISPAELMS